jgi:hypothetical protein
MGLLLDALAAAAAILLVIALLHAYAQWTIRNIDQENRPRSPEEQ